MSTTDKKSPGIRRNGGKRPGAGRPKGSPNKITAQLKDMILQALDGAGGVEYLKQTALTNPSAFLPLVGKVLPLQLSAGDGKLEVRVRTF